MSSFSIGHVTSTHNTHVIRRSRPDVSPREQAQTPPHFRHSSTRTTRDVRAMPVRIRLARFGRKNAPHYRVYVADSRAPRDGKHVEIVGHYDPVAHVDGHKHVGLNIERIKYWLSVGAQPSDTVARLLGQAGVLPALPRRRGGSEVRGFAASASSSVGE